MAGNLVTLTVNLTEKSDAALMRVATTTGDTWTDAMNRAIQVYAYLVALFATGGEVWVLEPGDTEPTKLSVSDMPERR